MSMVRAVKRSQRSSMPSSNKKTEPLPAEAVVYLDSITKNVVADTGNPNDQYHLGRVLLKCLRDNPDMINQIDGNTGQSESNWSVATRSLQTAQALRNWGLRTGDVLSIMSPLRIDVCIPFYASLYLCAPVLPIDNALLVYDLKEVLAMGKPKIIFCQSEKAEHIKIALAKIDHRCTIVTFDEKNGFADFSFKEFLLEYEELSVDSFEMAPEDESNLAFIICTSGTTGRQKGVMLTHRILSADLPVLWTVYKDIPEGGIALNLSALHWITNSVLILSATIFKFVRLQTSAPITTEHVYQLVNKYKPAWTLMSPNFATELMKYPNHLECDFSCFNSILLTGGACPRDVVENFQKLLVNGRIYDGYGMTEAGYVFKPCDKMIKVNMGRPMAIYDYKLVEPNTNLEVGCNTHGELWVRGPTIAKGYYGDSITTAEYFLKDGWYKTGDLFFYDEECNFFFVDRLKMMLKTGGYHISPVELEEVIRSHVGVQDVAVVGIYEMNYGDMPVACIVRKGGINVTARDIKDLVKSKLAPSKKLRGGVVFVEKLPLSTNGKLDRNKIKKMVENLHRE